MKTLTITADNNYTLKLVYKDEAGWPIDITGATAEFVMRRSMYSPELIRKQASINGTEGKVVFELEPTDTGLLLDNTNEEKFIYAAQLEMADGKKVTLATGDVILKQNIARI